jgi:uncharacterized protein YjbI with pentapeptide repeats
MLRAARLPMATMAQCQMKGAMVTDAAIPSSVWTEAQAQGANFSGTNLEWADFSHARLDGADFRDANLRGVNFHAVSESDIQLEGADVEGLRRTDTDLLEAERFKPVKGFSHA